MSRVAIITGWRIHPPWLDGTTVLARNFLLALLELEKEMDIDVGLVSTFWIPAHRKLGILKEEFVRYSSVLRRLSHVMFIKEPLIDPAIPLTKAIIRVVKSYDEAYVHVFDPVAVNEIQILYLLRKLSNLVRTKVNVIVHRFTVKQCVRRVSNTVVHGNANLIAFTDAHLKNIYEMMNVASTPSLIIPPTIDTRMYKPINVKAEELAILRDLGIPLDKDHYLLYMGPLTSTRFPVDEMLNVLKNIKERGYDVTLIIAVRDLQKYYDMARIIKKRAYKYDLSENLVILKRFLTEREKILLYNFVKALILPLYSRVLLDHDIVVPPLTILEAMACGTFVVTSENLHSLSLIRENDGNSTILTFNSSRELISIMESILSDSSLLKKVANIGRGIIEHKHSLESVKSVLKDVYQTY